MGGNALKSCKTRRYDATEYDHITLDIAHKLVNNGIICTRIPSYFTKETFGDLDILVKTSTLPDNWVEKIVEWFQPKEYVKNGNVLSFEYKEFQIDLIATPDEDWLSSFFYFSFNDLGNLVGRVAHSMGLKLGHDGLTYCWRVDTHKFRDITLLKDWKDILPVLGYDYERYAQGFNTLEDIFKFVVSSPFFNKDIYLLHNRNNTSRTRDRKRKTYMEFLKWIETYEETEEQWYNKNVHHESKESFLSYLFEQITEFKSQYDAVQAEYEQEIKYKSRFNGNLVKEWIGLEGKELGEFMKWFKNYYGEDKLKTDVLKINPKLIQGWVMYYVDKWTKENNE